MLLNTFYSYYFSIFHDVSELVSVSSCYFEVPTNTIFILIFNDNLFREMNNFE